MKWTLVRNKKECNSQLKVKSSLEKYELKKVNIHQNLKWNIKWWLKKLLIPNLFMQW
jgi:hypothetical protein